ncbi:MAG: DNA double-strand break repair nuclease NurA, partial [Candidatus Babeliales bacterium]
FDGTLVFWHLEAKQSGMVARFLPSYLQSLEKLFCAKQLYAGYISLPKSRELVNVMKVALDAGWVSDDISVSITDKTLVHSVDALIASFFLREGERTVCFKSNAAIVSLYPTHLQPYFFYMATAHEIVRIEIPAWIATDVQEARLDRVAQLIFDQIQKGKGYPVVLAEAHEQAVIQQADRDFFYRMVADYSAQKNQGIVGSQKQHKKKYKTV